MTGIGLDIALIGVALVAGAIMWLPRLRAIPAWRAMVTPLASIIGSGFLIVGPVLEAAFGYWAPAAMAALCLTAWAYGAAVRNNIARIGETGDPRPRSDQRTEILASVLLAFAYMISVAYYLNLFGVFAVSLTPWNTALAGRIVTTAIFAVILIVGWTRGFAALERMEYASVAVKLAIIAALVAGLGVYFAERAATGTLILNPPTTTGLPALALLMGLLVTVQGFETARYLGGSYDVPTRIRAMCWSQIFASVIYLGYIALMAFVFREDQLAFSETAIVDMMRIVAPVLPILLVAAALAAQFSAAVADTSGSGGLLTELTHHRLSPRQSYVLLVLVGLGLTWAADVFQIVAFASRAFAAYYAVQALLAAIGSRRDGQHLRSASFAALALFGVVIALFGQAVES